jgi:hypothetical protein
MGNDDCQKSKVANISKALAKKAGSLIAKYLCSQLQNLAGALKAVLQAELALLEPILALEEVFLENFVVFPLNASIKITKAVSTGLSKPLNDFGIDKKCRAGKDIHTQTAKVTAPIKAEGRKMESARDATLAEIERSRERIKALQNAIEALDDILNIQCQ